MPDPRREVRLALVLNGGVSLAIWIGGVTKEIDELRLSSEPEERRQGIGPTGELYGELMKILGQSARVDVIAGASAGGINGILLAAAIFSGKPLPDGLREIWIGLGDFRALLRSPADRDSPSLMKGDDVVLTQLRTTLGEILRGWGGRKRPSESLFLYVTATDLLGRWLRFQDTTGRQFQERDHRRVITFEHRRDDADPAKPSRGDDPPMPVTVRFVDTDAPELLARAGRATASFPVAFEPHGLSFVGEKPTDIPDHRWLIDGGLLDNQPFNPVLDRISVLPSAVPVRRVVAYVVPYVNEAEGVLGKALQQEKVEPTARQVYGAAGALPRTLPKLESLERVLQERRTQRTAEEDRRRLWRVGPKHQDQIRDAAKELHDAYRRTLHDAARRMFEAWSSDSFTPGDGVLAQSPAVDPQELPRVRGQTAPQEPAQDTPWVPPSLDWRDHYVWRWGLEPAERVAAWGLLFLRDALESPADDPLRKEILAARELASNLTWTIRQRKRKLQQTFAETDRGDPVKRALAAFDRERQLFVELKADFVRLDDRLVAIGSDLVPSVRDLLCLEVVRNAFSIDDPRVPFPFDFLFMSAGIRNSLNHSADSPEKKLAGMKAGHFGGFLKRSWRANDWLWGRLDGVQHVIRATVDLDWVAELPADDVQKLAEFAFPPDHPELETLERLSKARLEDAKLDVGDSGQGAFLFQLQKAFEHRRIDQEQAIKHFRPCQGALAARIQLAVLDEDLERVAATAAEDVEAGSSRLAHGARWAGGFFRREPDLGFGAPLPLTTAERVKLFESLRIGQEETLAAEANSRASIELASQTVAVAASVFAGNRGGLPLVVRSALAGVRGVTLVFSGFARLLAGSPAIGAGLLAVLAALVVWGLVAPNALLGALLPALIALTIAVGYVLLTIATGLLEPGIAGWKRTLGAVLLVAVPLAVAVACALGWLGLDGWWTRGVVLVLLAGAVVLAGVRLLLERRPEAPAPRRSVLAWYRLFVIAALVAYGVGMVVEPLQEDSGPKAGCDPRDPCAGIDWASVADERAGLILVAVLLAVALLAAALVELIVPAWKSLRAERRARERDLALRASLRASATAGPPPSGAPPSP